MSIPDSVLVLPPGSLPTGFTGFPHRLALLPNGVTIIDLGKGGSEAAVFLIEPGWTKFAPGVAP